jgi:maltooligosyltrehalose synthase
MRGKTGLPIGEAWSKDQLRTPLPPGTRFTNFFSGESVMVTDDQTLPLSALLKIFPVALLITE